MANQQDVDRAAQTIRRALEQRDLEGAKKALAELLDLEKTFDLMLGKVSLGSQRELLEQLKASVRSHLVDHQPRIDELELDKMDPNYEERARRRAETERAAKEAERSKAAEVLQGLGGPFAALAGLANLGRPAPAPSAAPAGAPQTDVACPSCQSLNPKRAKFCMECGKPMTRKCGACGADLGKAKFCPECGAKT